MSGSPWSGAKLVFDGRDVTDSNWVASLLDRPWLAPCPYCGTMRDARVPFCCAVDAVPPGSLR